MVPGRRRINPLYLVFITALIVVGLLLPLLRTLFPRLNSYFGFIPFFFFFPFFWAFGGRRRYYRSQKAKKEPQESGDQTGYQPSGTEVDSNSAVYYDSGLAGRSSWSYAKFVPIALVIVLAFVIYYYLYL